MSIDKEKELLLNTVVSKHDLRREIEDQYDDEKEYGEGYLENILNDKFKIYKNLVDSFGEKVFDFNENTEVIKLNKNFKAKEEYLLCLSLMEIQEDGKRDQMAKYFEEVVAESLVSLFGSNSTYELCDNSRNSSFSVEELAKKMQENFYRELRNDRKIQEGDGSCDIVFWKRIDESPGLISVLVQCKSGRNWQSGLPVADNVWSSLINFTVKPMIAYAITDLLSIEEIRHQSLRKGMIFDRARIVRLLADSDNSKINAIRRNITSLDLG
jgi:hypothetical protein